MQIDRSNYEIWFIDWLDGNLSSLQAEQLISFLDKNPDLGEELNCITSLNFVSSANSYPHKEQLKKSASDISLSQFEYLCAAYLENDLTKNQQTELMDIINTYPERKKTFELIQKTIITPYRITYRHKSYLLKRTIFQKALRYTVIGLGTAASISLILITNPFKTGTTFSYPDSSAYYVVSDSTSQRSSSGRATDKNLNGSIPITEKRGENKITSIHNEEKVITRHDIIIAHSNDSMVRKIDSEGMIAKKVPLFDNPEIRKDIINNRLIASTQTIDIPEDQNERSRVGRFVSRTFREKFLKEKTPAESPLKGYEIAEAGVTGLNKLFGWQMALDRKNDENGQIKSVYFSSKILKVNAPVKKRETQP
jgi:hypothetical protein